MALIDGFAILAIAKQIIMGMIAPKSALQEPKYQVSIQKHMDPLKKEAIITNQLSKIRTEAVHSEAEEAEDDPEAEEDHAKSEAEGDREACRLSEEPMLKVMSIQSIQSVQRVKKTRVSQYLIRIPMMINILNLLRTQVQQST